MYQYILFDFDGTIFDTVEGITKSVKYAINKQGLDAELEELRCFAGPPLVDMFMERFGFSKELAEQATEDFRERYQPIGLYECCVFPGIRETVEELRKAGRKTAVATSKPQQLAEELLQQENMTELFDAVCGSRLVGNNSAKSQIVEWVMEDLGAEKENTILVGDTKYDVEGAHKCGIKCIGVEYGYAAPGELENSGADYIVKDAAELLELLLKI